MAMSRKTEEMPRLVDYFVVCGLKEECLAPDKFGGKEFDFVIVELHNCVALVLHMASRMYDVHTYLCMYS